jgi:hypothetical protein
MNQFRTKMLRVIFLNYIQNLQRLQ